MELIVVIAIIVTILYCIVYAIFYISAKGIFILGKTAEAAEEGFSNLLDGKGFAFLKDNLAEDERILVTGHFRLSHIFPSFSYLCITIPVDILLTWIVFRANHVFFAELGKLTFRYSNGLNAILMSIVIFLLFFAFTSFWGMVFRFINRRKSEFLITTSWFAIRQFSFFKDPVVCRFHWEDFISAELYQNVLDSICGNYTLRLTFESSEGSNNYVDVLFLRKAKDIKKQIDTLAKEWGRNANL